MFVVLLRFSANRARAAQFMDGHRAWIRQGVADGVFVLVGSVKPEQGGVIVARGASLAELQQRVAGDPFVAEGVVSAEILEIAPSEMDERLRFLVDRVHAAEQGGDR